MSQIQHLAKQMYPRKTWFLTEAFKDATTQPYGYLVIGLKPETQGKYRVRTNVFPSELNFVYLSK